MVLAALATLAASAAVVTMPCGWKPTAPVHMYMDMYMCVYTIWLLHTVQHAQARHCPAMAYLLRCAVGLDVRLFGKSLRGVAVQVDVKGVGTRALAGRGQ